MQLLSEDKLLWSPIVANNRMNRERNSSGINSYEQELKFKPEDFLADKIRQHGQASWLDICCGQGKALLQTATYFRNLHLQQKIKLVGVDLINTFQPIGNDVDCVKFILGSVLDDLTDDKYDLITCVHGLHYLGNRLQVITTTIRSLQTHGLFIANMDLNNIVIQGVDSTAELKSMFKRHHIKWNGRNHTIQHQGPAKIDFGLIYLGADDKAGPNYTGQEAVNSYYLSGAKGG